VWAAERASAFMPRPGNMSDNDFAKARSDYITIAFVLVSALMSMRRMTS
jgi:hypothetical protein